jgi:hypothetical protein
LEIQSQQKEFPIIAHLDFTLCRDKQRIQVVEVKSCEHMPETVYAAYEMQLTGQLSLLRALWDQPCFNLRGPDGGYLSKNLSFPELVQKHLSIVLPAKAEQARIEGYILMLSMSEARQIGPYYPNAIILQSCQAIAREIWRSCRQIQNGQTTLSQTAVAQGFYPLCDWCEHNADCPRFSGIEADELEHEIVSLQAYKVQKQLAETGIKEHENRLKQAFLTLSPEGNWIAAQSYRFRVASCEGRKSLDKELLKASLLNRMNDQNADDLLDAACKSAAPYQRLYVSPINGGK